MNWTSSLRFLVVVAMLGAFSSSAGIASELPPIVPAEAIAHQLSPSAPLPSGRKKKIGFVPAGEDPVATPPVSVSGPVSQRIALPAIEFEFDSDRLTPRAREQVAELAKGSFARRPPLSRLRSPGPYGQWWGDGGYNRALSLRRASAVKRHLVAKNIADDRLVEVGLGEDYPLRGLAGADARNRRVEIVHLGSTDGGSVPSLSQDAGRKALLIGIDAYRSVLALERPGQRR